MMDDPGVWLESCFVILIAKFLGVSKARFFREDQPPLEKKAQCSLVGSGLAAPRHGVRCVRCVAQYIVPGCCLGMCPVLLSVDVEVIHPRISARSAHANHRVLA
jgi:hypothetical protein